MGDNVYQDTYKIPPDCFERKPVLKKIYKQFYQLIAEQVAGDGNSLVVEIGSGPGNIKEEIPYCLRTGLFPMPWIDRVENAYQLSFAAETVSNLILFDVFHHLQYPGTALIEFYRVLKPRGRVIIFEPCLSLLGRLIYGVFHHEPMGLKAPISWSAPPGWRPEKPVGYAASMNAWKVFCRHHPKELDKHWNVLIRRPITAIAYAASGGYSKPQLYPDALLPLMRRIDSVCRFFPILFATRLLVVLEKKE
jgi:SAM-dependent methyltransferase